MIKRVLSIIAYIILLPLWAPFCLIFGIIDGVKDNIIYGKYQGGKNND